MRTKNLVAKPWTIIQRISIYQDYPHLALSTELRERFSEISGDLPPSVGRGIQKIILLFECYLQITRQTLNVEKLASAEFAHIAHGFVGALESDVFVKATIGLRYKYRLHFRQLITVYATKYGLIQHIPEAPSTIRLTTLTVGESIKQFLQTRLSSYHVWIWSGWKLQNLSGKNRWLLLEPLTRSFDRAFVESFYNICRNYFANGRGEIHFHLNLLAKFLAAYPKITPRKLLDQDFANAFWSDFSRFFLQEALKTYQIDNIPDIWRGLVKFFAEHHLFTSGLFAAPDTFPIPPRRKQVAGTNHLGVDKNGTICSEKLLTHIPLHLSHREAIDILFRRLEHDVSLIMNWANAEAAALWNAFRNRTHWETVGTPRRLLAQGANSGGVQWLVDRTNPDHLRNAAATIAVYHGGYIHVRETPNINLILPSRLGDLARELGFPTALSLLPHMTILVNEHPEITPAYLESLEVFDNNGRIEALIHDDSGYILKGIKMRRGAEDAEQQIVLSPRAVEIVKQVLAITAAPRNYLRKRKNSDWKYLFLSTGKAFGLPRRVSKISELTSNIGRHATLASQFGKHNNIDELESLDLARRFSLPKLRASLGVIEYVATCSGPKMAEKLGHKNYDEKLISRYLPAAIKAFLQTRYIRIMQTGIIVEAMKNSPHLLEAASFNNVDELSAFLSTHALRFSSNRPVEYLLNNEIGTPIEEATNIERIVFNINDDVLTIYASLELALRKQPEATNSLAHFWNKIGVRLMAFIEEKQAAEPRQMDMLNRAREKADIKFVETVLYE